MKTARQFAIRDIAKHLREEEKKRGFRSLFIIAPSSLYTQENRRLNELLGIRSINLIGNKNGLKNKDRNQWDNRFGNLNIVSNREKSSAHKTDVGVFWDKDNNKWRAQIWICNKKVHLGYFTEKQDALDKYKKALENMNLYNGDAKQFRNILTL